MIPYQIVINNMTQEITVPFVSLSRRVIMRFVKVFISGGLAALTIQLVQIPTFSDMLSVKVWLTTLGIAFLAGGVAALEKYFSSNE